VGLGFSVASPATGCDGSKFRVPLVFMAFAS
jgi:hypothetical protein